MSSRRILLALMFCFACASAQTTEYYFRFEISSIAEVDRLTNYFSIDKLEGDLLYGYANDREWEWLQNSDYKVERLIHPSSLYEHEMSSSVAELMMDWDTYPTYGDYVAMMNQYAADYPALCRLEQFGTSIQGRELLVMKISDNPDDEEDEPEFFYTSTMHGDETVGYPLMIRLIDYLLTEYGGSSGDGPRITEMVDNMEIWINPLSNPDGTYRTGDNTVNGAWRYNSQGVDLNRDFPDRISDPNNTTTGRALETQHMMNFVAAHNFDMSANFHTGAQVVNYPWDNGRPSGQYSACPDDSWFVDTSIEYANYNQDILSGGFSNGITNGCQWYAIFGGRQDWIYHWHGGRETTIELYNTKNPPGSALPLRWDRNRESFLSYIEFALEGIRGVVTDALTGEPVSATIEIEGLDGSTVYTDPDVGDYHRLLLPGNYTMTIAADGYIPQTINDIGVDAGPAVRHDIMLLPEAAAAITCDLTLLQTSGDGNLTYAMAFENTTDENQNADLWLIATGPAGFNEQLFVKNKNFAPAASATKNKAYSISSSTPGDYTFTLYTGTYPDIIQDSDSKVYVKTLSSLEAQYVAQLNGQVPTKTELIGNYPNPFNPTTKIRLNWAGSDEVAVFIYDIQGRSVRSPLALVRNPGVHEIVWDGTNDLGKPVSSGVYFYQLSAKNQELATKKMILIR